MNLGKAGLVAGGLLVVGTVGAVALGAPVEVDALLPVGMFELQMPVGLFEIESEAVSAPEVIVTPEEPEILVAPHPAVEGGTILDVEEVAPTEKLPEDEAVAVVQSETAVETAAELQALESAYGTCAGHR